MLVSLKKKILVKNGQIFQTDSQSLLNAADRARHRRESVQKTFGAGPTK